MTVAENDRISTGVGTGSQRLYFFDYPIALSNEIVVRVAGAVVSPTGYSVDVTGRSITFAVPPTAGQSVSISGRTPAEQLITYSRESNTLKLDALEPQLDQIVKLQQELRRDTDDLDNRAVLVAPGQFASEIDLTPFLGAGGLLGLDASGAFVRIPSGAIGSTIVATQIIDSTVAGRTLLTAASAATQRTALGLDQLAGLSYRDVTLTDPSGPGGFTKSVPLAALIKGPIKLVDNYTIVEGSGISSAAATANTNSIFRAMNEASAQNRELEFPPEGIIEITALTVTSNNIRLLGKNCTLRSTLTGAVSSSVLYGRPVNMTGTDRIRRFECRDMIFDLNGHLRSGAGSGGYCLAVVRSADTVIDNCTFLNPYSGAAFFQDDYGAAPRPGTVSTNLIFTNNEVVRTNANLTAYGTNPLMRQGDQVAIVGIRNVLIDNNTFIRSGRSGISLGMNEIMRVSNNLFSSCWAAIYVETLERGTFLNNFIEGHEHFNGDAIQQIADPIINDSYGMLIGDKDLTFPGLGYAAARDLTIDGLFISNISRDETTGAFRGLCISGRNGAGLGATNISVSNVVGRGIGGGTDSCLVSVRGQVSNSTIRNVHGSNVPIVARVDEAYTTFGGASTNVLNGVWLDNLNAESAGYAVKTASGNGAHLRSGIRNSNFGGCPTAFPLRDKFSVINCVR